MLPIFVVNCCPRKTKLPEVAVKTRWGPSRNVPDCADPKTAVPVPSTTVQPSLALVVKFPLVIKFSLDVSVSKFP